jgi:hypothetical protein
VKYYSTRYCQRSFDFTQRERRKERRKDGMKEEGEEERERERKKERKSMSEREHKHTIHHKQHARFTKIIRNTDKKDCKTHTKML